MTTPAAPEVVVVGNIGIDTNIYHPADAIDFSVEANFTENIDYVGQAGGYASRGYAALGYRTAFIGHVGDDYAGRQIREILAADRIDTRALWVDPQGTARSVNFMFRDGGRKNFYDGKGHMILKPDLALCRSVMQGARLAHFNIPNWARYLLPLAHASGLVVACDLQDVIDPAEAYRRDFIDGAEIVFCSATNYPDPAPLITALLGRRPSLVIVGMGARGCAVGTSWGITYYPPVSLDLPLVDTNGAGDGLAVGFLTSYVLEGRPLDQSIRRAQITARYTCALRATTDGLITAAQLEALERG